MNQPKITDDRLRQVLNYDKNTGVFTWAQRLSPIADIGSVAGCVQPGGHIHIGIDGVYYGAHRLAWLYVTGQWPMCELDHKNLDKTDNRFNNLRLATNQQQSANRPASRNNRSGFKGVGVPYRPRKTTTPVRYRARIRVNHRLIHLGYYKSPEAANAAYAEAARLHFGGFARSA